MQYSEELKARLIARSLRGGITQDALAEEFGISRSTVQNWMREYRISGEKPLTQIDKRAQSWTKEQRLEALLATHGLAEDELGAWCRERGVHTHHLAQWRRELVEGSSEKDSGAGEARALRQENQALKKELRRKDEALAETTALLVLKKKRPRYGGKSRTTDQGSRSPARVGTGGASSARRVPQGQSVRATGIVATHRAALGAR